MKFKNKIKNGMLLIAILTSSIVMAQRTITGSVKDSNGELLPGASVVIKGSTIGVAATIEGIYTINVPDGATALIFTYLGYVDQEVPIGTRTTINVIMQTDSRQLKEVVISTGYRTVSKTQVTGSYATISSESMDKVMSPSLLDKLEGQLAGVDIRDGNIIIRGQNTFNTGDVDVSGSSNPNGVTLADGSEINYRTNPSAPLIIVDGFPYEGSLDDLDPLDVENLTVLKDAASASIWGSKAANGVIVINRKRAPEDGKTEIRFDAFVGISDEPSISDYNLIPAYRALDFELFKLDSLHYRDELNISSQTTTALEEIYYKRDFSNELTWPQAERLIQQLRMQSNYSQGQEAFLRSAITKNYNFQLSHSSGKLSNILSMNYTDKEFGSVGNNNNKINIGLRSAYNITDWASLNINYNTLISNAANNSMANYFTQGRLRPYENFMDATGNYLPMNYSRGVPYRYRSTYEALGYQPWHWNALEEQNLNDNTTKGSTHTIQVAATIKLPYGFTYSGLLQYGYGQSDKVLLYGKESFFVRNMINTYTQHVGEAAGVPILKYNVPTGGGIRQNTLSKNTNTNVRHMLDFNQTFDKHSIMANFGTDLIVSDNHFDTQTILGFNDFSGNHGTKAINLRDLTIEANSKSLDYTFNGLRYVLTPYTSSTGFTKSRNFSTFGVVGYSFDNRYNLTGSGRIEKSNLTGWDKSNFLWSVGAGWTISNEGFFSDLSNSIDYLRLRSSYGFTGNVDRSALPFLRGVQTVDVVSGNEYLYITEPSNPRLKMEKTRNINIGLDLNMFNDRIKLTADLYANLSKNLIVKQNVDPTFRGWTSAKENNGTISNNGIDIKLDALVLDSKDLSWNSTLNLGYNKSKVVDYLVDNSPGYYSELLKGNKQAPGYANNSLFTYNNGDLDANGGPTIYINYREPDPDEDPDPDPATGPNQVSTSLVDENGNAIGSRFVIDIDDLVYHGSRVPKFYGGFFNTFTYKQFSLSFNVNYSLGGYMYMPKADLTYEAGNTHTKEVLDAWNAPGDEAFTQVPRMISGEMIRDPYLMTTEQKENHLDWYNYSSHRVEKSDVVRLRYITLGYNMPRSITQKIGMKSLRFNFQVDNVAFWAANSRKMDPSYMNRPHPKTFTIGIYTKI